MTNAQIITNESFRLMDEGILKGSGTFAETADGEKIELPEEIHTFSGWKSLGYIVKKGEKAVASFPIWKVKANKKKNNSDSETIDLPEDAPSLMSPDMFMKNAFWFKSSQVVAIAE